MNEPIKNEYNEVVVVVDYGFEKLRIKSQYSNPKISKHGGGGWLFKCSEEIKAKIINWKRSKSPVNQRVPIFVVIGKSQPNDSYFCN